MTSRLIASALLAGACTALAGTGSSYAATNPLLRWATGAGGSGSDSAYGIAALPDGSSIVSGWFSGTATFGGTTLTSAGNTDVFAAKMDADGTWAWATRAGGSAGTDDGYGASALPDGSSVIVGRFTGTAAFGGTTLTSSGGTDVFAAKMNADGSWAWAVRAGGTGTDVASAVSVLPDGSAIVTGWFTGTATFGAITLTGTGSTDAFVAKVRADGTWAWATATGGTGQAAESYGVSAFADGSALVTGRFSGVAEFGATTLTSAGQTDVFVAKVDPGGAWAWAARAGGTSLERGWGVSALPDGSALAVGSFSQSAQFGDSTLVSGGGTEGFIARINARGTWAWAIGTGGTGDDELTAVSALPNGSATTAGRFQGTLTLGDTTLTSSVANSYDVVAAQLTADRTWAWAARGGGPVQDMAYGVAAFPDGSSTVTGNVTTPATFGDITLTGTGGSEAFVARYLNAPQPPAAPTAVAGDASATVTVVPVVGGSVTSYSVRANSGGHACEITAPATACRVAGLSGGTQYTFTATATNAAGTSAASAPSNAVAPTGAGASATLTATLLPQRTRLRSGQTMRIGIRTANTGATTAREATSCIVAPANLRAIAIGGATRSGRTYCFRLGDLAAGAKVSRAITVRAISARAVKRTVKGTTSAAGLGRVSAAPRTVAISPRTVFIPVTG